MAYKVCLLDSDPAYQRALMEYLNLRATIPIQLSVFSNPAVYKAFRERDCPALLLVGDAYADWKDTEECPVFVLTENREYAGQERYVFRYQNAETLVETILQMVGKRIPEVVEPGMFYAVYSPIGRCGKTAFAKSLCGQLSPGLYVNWEGIPEEMDDGGIGSWILYCLKSRNEECLTYLQESEVRSLPPPDSFHDICQIEAEDVRWFQQAVKKRRLFEGVVFDIGGMVLANYAVLASFDRIFVPTLKDSVSGRKMKVFEQMLQQEGVAPDGMQYICLEGMDVEQAAKQYMR